MCVSERGRREKRAFCVKRSERMDVDYRDIGGNIGYTKGRDIRNTKTEHYW